MKFDDDAIGDFLEQVTPEGNPRIYTLFEKGVAAIGELPPAWESLRASPFDQHLALASLWNEAGLKLPLTLEILQRKLVAFMLLTTDSEMPSLLYLFDEGRDLVARRGYWPAKQLPAVTAGLAADLWPFYRLHDGWVSLFSGEAGPLPSKQWVTLGMAPGVNGFLQVFSKGSQSIGFDLDEHPAMAYSIDADDEEVEQIKDFWSELDDCLAGGLRSFPDA